MHEVILLVSALKLIIKHVAVNKALFLTRLLSVNFYFNVGNEFYPGYENLIMLKFGDFLKSMVFGVSTQPLESDAFFSCSLILNMEWKTTIFQAYAH